MTVGVVEEGYWLDGDLEYSTHFVPLMPLVTEPRELTTVRSNDENALVKEDSFVPLKKRRQSIMLLLL